MMANIWEKAISILAGNLNSGLSYLITTVNMGNAFGLKLHNHKIVTSSRWKPQKVKLVFGQPSLATL